MGVRVSPSAPPTEKPQSDMGCGFFCLRWACPARAFGEARPRFKEAAGDLEPTRERAAVKLSVMGKTSASGWGSTKKGFAAASDELHLCL
jgi:hypothetical protein